MTNTSHPEASEPALGVGRRRFIRNLAVGASGAALGLSACSGSSGPEGSEGLSQDGFTPSEAPKQATGRPLTDAAGRALVVIELDGGNDGLDTLVPFNSGRYMDLRGNVGVDPSTVLQVDDEMGLNPNLTALHSDGFAVIEGVGMAAPDLSHFESSRRWWQGDMAGTATFATGFLGRLCDSLHADEPVTGVSISRLAAPAMRSEKSVTLSLPDPYGGGWLLSEDPFVEATRQGIGTMALTTEGATPLTETARANMTRALDFLDLLASLPDREDDDYPGGQLARQLSTCARLMAADAGIRVFHVRWGNFDTHDGHRGSHDNQLLALDEAVAAFRRDLADLGLDGSTLLATTSEFGRRPKENARGTDHGTASTMLLAGPVNQGRHGLNPSLDALDDDGNLVATVGMDEYYATLSESWFGIPSGDVLPNAPTPIPGIVA